jgi:hypothetical protein
MEAGRWGLKVTAGIGNKIIDTHGTFNQPNQPTPFVHVSHLDPPYQQWAYQLTVKSSIM